jgi:RNA polymerase sigma-70 factor, ECF subfamily
VNPITTGTQGAPTAELVWRQFGEELQTFVRRRIADQDRADDVVASVLLRVHQNLHTVKDQGRLAAWVYRIARNAITDEYRRRGQRPEPLDDHEQSVEPEGGADLWIDDQAAVLAELAACMRPLLEQLPDEFRRALGLVELEGVTQTEAARREGISVSGMKSRVQRARRHLAGLLQQCCELTLDARGLPLDYRSDANCACACGCS